MSRGAQRSTYRDPSPAVAIEHAYNRKVDTSAGTDPSGAGLMEALTQYCESYSDPEPPLLSRLRDETLAHYASAPGAARMLCDPLQGRLLAMLASITGAKLVLELGAFTGYSAICLAQGLDHLQDAGAATDRQAARKVITCEPDAVARGIAERYIVEGGLHGAIDLRNASAMSVIDSLRADPAQPLLDLVFLDADKKQYASYIQALMGDLGEGEARGRALLKEGALIVVDNTLWKGLVLDCSVR
ncbi:MAG: hypothetical protein B7Z23_08480 [Pseudomonadales bacterium 32-61-5]|nr:MAG: hypothetical protein B7Z23_08480 [Pseudomonadales bacterium 32-61-5]